MIVSRQAGAKLNLGLRILGRREDGFHDIRSIFQEITLSDEIEVSISRGSGNVTVEAMGDAPSGPENIAWKAASLFLDVSGQELDITVRIEKGIPSRAGLGGGSSDAACVLKSLAELTGRTDMDLVRLSRELGSDVPFFINGGAALVEGRGELLTPVPAVPFSAVLIHPQVQVSTPHAYEMWDREMGRYLTNSNMIRHYSASSAVWHEGKPFPHDLRNDFLPLLEKHIHEVAEVAEFLREAQCRNWGLSGSGPTFYVLFESSSDALSFSRTLHWNNSICRSSDTAGASSNG